MTPEISIITVNFGSASKVKALWKSLQEFSPSVSWEFVVVDNHSARNEGEELETFLKDFENAHVIKLARNTGFGVGNEEGIKFAKSEIIAIVNPDIEIQSGTFDELLKELRTEKVGILTPIMETHDKNPLPNTWNFPSPLGLLSRRLFGKKETIIPVETSPVEWAQGSFLMMQKSFFTETLKGFDHRYFLFLEDTDLCRRCWETGHRVLQVPTAKAFHGDKRLSGKGIWQSLKKKTFWIHILSALKYFWKYRNKKHPDIF
jgi:N-acetylglucosaminyl-diphospho-decaprenol L-rhamnosyltransferase